MTVQIILASASPRRRELLDQIGVRYIVRPVDIDETPKLAEAPLAYVQRIAAEKSAACVVTDDSMPVMAADTAVIFNSEILGKPVDRDHGVSMLRQLSGSTHQVFTAISLRGRQQHGQAVSITDVTFRQLNDSEIAAYWDTGEPIDKAGAYAIQGLGSIFVQTITGSFSGVMGLPLYETADLLAKQGIDILR